MLQALRIYRYSKSPSQQLDRPFVMRGVNIFTVETGAAAQLLTTSMQQVYVNLRSGLPGKLPSLVVGCLDPLTPQDKAVLADVLPCSAIDSLETVCRALRDFVAFTTADELIITNGIFAPATRRHSYAIVAQVCVSPWLFKSEVCVGSNRYQYASAKILAAKKQCALLHTRKIAYS